VLESPCFIISDTHLGVAPTNVERSLLAFLKALPGRARSLVINGDLLDFWFEWRAVVPRSGLRVLAALADAREAGVDVLWVAGNHDCWGGEVLRKDLGLDYRIGTWEGRIGGWMARVEHGDGLRPREDRGYRALRRLLRHPAAVRAFRWIHPDLASSLASGSSHASRNYRARDEGAGLRAIALAGLESRPELDLLLYGHSHVATIERAPTGSVYANAGSWLDAPTFLVVTPERIELREWGDAGSAEGLRLDALDRRA
jgi:UDP-2,3-diacylglucosamine hydrolase